MKIKSSYIIFNLGAGQVEIYIKNIVKEIIEAAKKTKIFIDMMNVDALKDLFQSNRTWEPVDIQFDESTGFDSLIIVGGDGTRTYIINRMIDNAEIRPIIGIGAGTMNVGRLTSFRFNLDKIDFSLLREEKINGIKIQRKGIKPSYAFHDAIIGTSCVTNIDGRITQVCAKELANGKKIECLPGQIGNEETVLEIKRNNGNIYKINQIKNISIIAAAPLSANLKAHVLTGGADPCSCLDYPGGVIISGFPLTWASVSKEQIADISSISSEFSPLDYDDLFYVNGVFSHSYLICDGNSDGIFSDGFLSVEKNIACVYKRLKECEE